MRRTERYKYLSILLGLFLLASGCDRINPDEPIPAYIYIESVKVVSNPDLQGKEGSLSHDIIDVWVSAGGQIIGAYELPATIPILQEGDIEIFIAAGVKNNGQTGDRIIYPFFTNYSTTIKAIPGNIDTIKPQVMYRSNTKFAWKEGFETSAISLDSTTHGNMDSIYRTNDVNDILEPTWAGVVDMPITGIFEVQTNEEYKLPRIGAEVYLEVHFKGNIGVQFGFISNGPYGPSQIPILVGTPTEEWTKLYISLKGDLGNMPIEDLQRIFIGAVNFNETVKPRFYLDNLKLIHFE